jgi:hypothetical protein
LEVVKYAATKSKGDLKMKKVLLITVLITSIFLPRNTYSSLSKEEKNQLESNGIIQEISFIKILVKSCKVRIEDDFGNFVEMRAATPALKNIKDVPFGKIGHIYKTSINPSYIPTEKHLLEEKRKGTKNPRKFYPPSDEENPLGTMKVYFSFYGIDSKLSFGMHTTNKECTIGKRVSEGCARLSKYDMTRVIYLLLLKEGYGLEEINQVLIQANESPEITIPIILTQKIKVVYLNK